MEHSNHEQKAGEISAHICQLLADVDEHKLMNLTQDLAAGVLPDISASLPTLYTLLTALAMSHRLPKRSGSMKEEDIPIIDELLHDLPSADGQAHRARRVSLERIVGRAATMFINNNYYDAPKLNLSLESGTTIRGNASDLDQAFFHLMLGAHEHLGTNGSIRVKSQIDEANAIVSITPRRSIRTGNGDAPLKSYQGPPAFIPFALASQVIDAHGGTLCVKGRQNTGPQVTVTLPRV